MNLESLGLLGLFIGTLLAATIVPFSSDALYIAVLAATKAPIECLLVGTAGNWIGSIISYWMGRLAKWEWLTKWFHVKTETIEKQKSKIDKYGPWLALLCWVPFVGDIFAIALGFYRCNFISCALLMLAGKFIRFAAWTALISLY